VVTCARRAVEGPAPTSSTPATWAATTTQSGAMIDAIFDRHGRLDVVVKQRRRFALCPDPRIPVQSSNRKIIELNLIGALSVSQHANDKMQTQQQGGAIVQHLQCQAVGDRHRAPLPMGSCEGGAWKA